MSVRVAHLGTTGNGKVGATVGVTDAAGAPLAKQGTTVTVETRAGNGAWSAASDVVVETASAPLMDVMIVADNSGSAESTLVEVQDAIDHMSQVLLARVHDDRVGLVRVSTEATVLQELTTDEAALGAAVDGMFASNGWTALWDGVRQGAEALARGRLTDVSGGLCYAGAAPSLVVFTDGQDNNSADEHDTAYDGDGIDTTLDQLLAVSVDGVRPAIYTVGVGDDVDEGALEALAESSGGRHVALQNHAQLVGALHSAAAQLDGLIPVCFTPASCEHDQARVTVGATQGNGAKAEVVLELALTPSCN